MQGMEYSDQLRKNMKAEHEAITIFCLRVREEVSRCFCDYSVHAALWCAYDSHQSIYPGLWVCNEKCNETANMHTRAVQVQVLTSYQHAVMEVASFPWRVDLPAICAVIDCKQASLPVTSMLSSSSPSGPPRPTYSYSAPPQSQAAPPLQHSHAVLTSGLTMPSTYAEQVSVVHTITLHIHDNECNITTACMQTVCLKPGLLAFLIAMMAIIVYTPPRDAFSYAHAGVSPHASCACHALLVRCISTGRAGHTYRSISNNCGI